MIARAHWGKLADTAARLPLIRDYYICRLLVHIVTDFFFLDVEVWAPHAEEEELVPISSSDKRTESLSQSRT